MQATIETTAPSVTLYSVLFLSRTRSGNSAELGRVRVSLAPDATPAAVEAVAVRMAARQGVAVHQITERQAFRLRAVAPSGAEVWEPLSRSGSNACGFDEE